MIQFIVKGNFNTTPENFKKLSGHYIGEFETLSNEERKELKKQFPQGYFRLAFWEKGGSDFDTGDAQLVCGISGEKLLPIKIRRKGWLANDRHALFVGSDLCLVFAHLEKREVTLTIKKYSVKAKIGIIEEEEVWQGKRESLEELPEEFKNFEEALKIAIKKVMEYRCTEPMYFEKAE